MLYIELNSNAYTDTVKRGINDDDKEPEEMIETAVKLINMAMEILKA
ncbi:MAG: hypothetical protein KAF91_00340 [Nostoc sp. TH1S01]|nr:hypothetical protein [Nostoc sp. TH1S01]